MPKDFFKRLKAKLLRPFEEAAYRGTTRAFIEDASNIRRELQRVALRQSADFVHAHIPLHLSFPDRNALLTQALKLAPPGGLFLEFGVWRGRTVKHMATVRPDLKFFGFDSFEGLPEPWLFRGKGAFDVHGALPIVPKNVSLIPGWFDKTLPKFLAEHPSFCSFVHVDCDIHSSTLFVLRELTPRIAPGTIIVFDEFMNHPRWLEEERKAFDDWREESGVECEFVGFTAEHTRTCSNGQQVAVRVKSTRAAIPNAWMHPMADVSIDSTKFPPRLLLCFGRGSEPVEVIVRANASHEARANMVWWTKSRDALNTLTSMLPDADYRASSVRRLRGDRKSTDTEPLHDVLAASSLMPAIKESIAYEEGRAARVGTRLSDALYFFSAALVCEAVKVIADVRPDALLIRGGTRLHEAAFAAVARALGIPIRFTERGAFPNSIFLDDQLAGPDLLRTSKPVAGDDTNRAAATDRFLASYLNTGESAWEQPDRVGSDALLRRLGVQPDEKVIFYAGQVEDDANMVLFSPHFKSNESFLRFVCKSLAGSKCVLVVKPHPKERKQIQDVGGEYGVRMIIDKQINVKEMIPLASAVVCLNSTTGFEALLYGRPVALGARAHYSHRGFTFDVAGAGDEERLGRFLREPKLCESQRAELKQFVYALFDQCLYLRDAKDGLAGPDDYLRRLSSAGAARVPYEVPSRWLEDADKFLARYRRIVAFDGLFPSQLTGRVKRGVVRTIGRWRNRVFGNGAKSS